MRLAYRRIFTRSGLQFKAVEADTGAIGGNRSEEFTVLAKSGEDEIVSCTKCDYGANQEKAEGLRKDFATSADHGSLEKFATLGLKTIDDLAKSLAVPSSQLAKTMIATDKEGRCLVILLRGDDELDEVKLSRVASQVFGSNQARLASEAEIRVWNLPKGSLGPVQFPREALILVDSAIGEDESLVVGANEEGFHFRHMTLKRDLPKYERQILRKIRSGESCPRCSGALQILRGIEVGHVFYLGQKYSKAMKVEVSDEKGEQKTLEMGCYGIGVGRTAAAAIEQNNDGLNPCFSGRWSASGSKS
jgi:prolyl-tRNA synthetase